MSTDIAPTQAKELTMDGVTISLSALGVRPGGTITVHADQVSLENSGLTTQGSGRGGSINFAEVGSLKLTNTSLSAFGEDISGGTITLGSVGTKSIKLADTTLSVHTLLSGQQGGTIEITASNLFESVRSTFDASSAGGIGGTISIHAGRLKVLDGSTINAQGAGPGQDGTIRFEFGNKLTVQDSVVTPEATIVSGWEAE
jgi:hypothetical protein